MRSIDSTRFEAGECSSFTSDLTELTDLTTAGTVTPSMLLILYSGLAGIVANENGVVTLATSAAATPASAALVGIITRNVNGTDRKFPYFR